MRPAHPRPLLRSVLARLAAIAFLVAAGQAAAADEAPQWVKKKQMRRYFSVEAGAEHVLYGPDVRAGRQAAHWRRSANIDLYALWLEGVLDVKENQAVVVTASSADFQPIVIVLDDQGAELKRHLGEPHIAGLGGTTELQFIPEDRGQYVFVVVAPDGGGGGVNLSVVVWEAPTPARRGGTGSVPYATTNEFDAAGGQLHSRGLLYVDASKKAVAKITLQWLTADDARRELQAMASGEHVERVEGEVSYLTPAPNGARDVVIVSASKHAFIRIQVWPDHVAAIPTLVADAEARLAEVLHEARDR